MALPRYGHLQQLYNIFTYLKKHHDTEMVFDQSKPKLNRALFERQDWSHSVYASGGTNLEEALPKGRPETRGDSCTMRLYADSDHAGNSTTRRSRTVFLVYL